MKYIVTLLLNLYFLGLWAQDSTKVDFIFVSNNFENKNQNSILIKWIPTEIISKINSYDIFRKNTNSQKWIKINTKPIKFDSQNSNKLNLGKTSSLYQKAGALSEHELKNAKILKIFVAISVVNNNNLARVMGLLYQDNTVVPNNTYQYRIKYAANNKIIGTSNPISSQKWTKQDAPKEIKIIRKRKKVEFSWLPEEKRYFSVDIYRWTNENLQKQKINKGILNINKENNKYPKIFFSDKSINKDSAYFYQLTAIDNFGQKTKSSKIFHIRTKDFDFAPVPFNLKWKADTNRVTLNWNYKDVLDLMGFNVYRSLNFDSAYQKVNTNLIKKPNTVFQENLKNAGEYFYKISSVDTALNENISSPIIANVKDVVAPKMPTGFIVKADTGKIIFNWNANPEPDIKGYYIYKALIHSKDFFVINAKPIKDTKYIEKVPKNVRNKFRYQIAVEDTSFNRSNRTESIIVQMPDVIPPQAPFIKSVVQVSNALYIIWIPNLEDDLDSYQLYRTNKLDTTTLLLKNNINKKDTSFTDETIKHNVAYQYLLRATDSTGNKSLKSEPYLGKFIDNKTDIKIEKFSANYKKSKNIVRLKWTIKKSNSFYGLIIFRQANNEKSARQISKKLIAETLFEDKKLNENKTYKYTIRVYDKFGYVIKSKEIEIKTPIKNK